MQIRKKWFKVCILRMNDKIAYMQVLIKQNLLK